MDRRFLLALVLTAIVILVTQWLFPPLSRRASHPPGLTLRENVSTRSTVTKPPVMAQGVDTLVTPVKPDTFDVAMRLAAYRFTTLGAAPIRVALRHYRSLRKEDGPVVLTRVSVPLLRYAVVTANDTIWLDRTVFSVDSTSTQIAHRLKFTTQQGSVIAELDYAFSPDSYLVRVTGKIQERTSRTGALAVMIPDGLPSEEADTLDDQRHLAYVVKRQHEDPQSLPFTKLAKLEVSETHVENGPLTWVAAKNKYFLTALIAGGNHSPFRRAVFPTAPGTVRNATTASAIVLVPLSDDGNFGFDLYSGPQEWRRLTALDQGLEDVNPYGGFLRGIVQPFATLVMRVLLWMHEQLELSYGWVLVIFGIVVRLVLWPLNQSAMRTSVRMQRLQPELAALQKKYRTNPEKQHTEMLRLYKEHDMSPFSPLSGCLPMLLPMPVLFALFFVFQNTIAFRGVSFLWLGDISQKDPLYILPVIMGLSMYVLSWIGLRNSPPNPQAKMMAYIFPVMMTVFFVNFASGLNLYYTVQNIAALPQQWLIARERAKGLKTSRS